ncbi:MAG: glycine oxidase ThiO [Vicinamibacterales bacterium]
MNVIVIGAGVVGCAVGYELAARGARVRLLDMRDVGRGATRASAGVLCPHIEGHAAPLLQLGARSLAMYDEFVAHVSHDARRPVEYRRTGTLEIAVTDEEAVRLKELAVRHARGGVEHRFLDRREALDLEPALSEEITGALYVPVHGYVGVEGFTNALAAASEARGATIERAATVRAVTGSTSGVQVTTEASLIEADAAVVAAGCWSGGIAVGLAQPPVRPIRGQLLHLELPEAVASRVIWGADCYMVPWEDGSVLVGATVEDVGFDEGATVAGVHDLIEYACDLLPPIWSARFREVRVGLRPATGDELPIIGRSSTEPGVFYATGHYRNGVLLAPFTAAAVADLVLNGREAPELAITDPRRFGL